VGTGFISSLLLLFWAPVAYQGSCDLSPNNGSYPTQFSDPVSWSHSIEGNMYEAKIVTDALSIFPHCMQNSINKFVDVVA